MTTLSSLCAALRGQLLSLYGSAEAESLLRLLVRHYLGLSPVDACLHEGEVPQEAIQGLNSAVERLLRHCPVQYIIGETEFYGHTITVTPDVLIPRPETEELTDRAIAALKHSRTLPKRIMDVCTGSGCIAIAMAAAFPAAEVIAVDVSRQALELAARNAARNAVSIHTVMADILHEAPDVGKNFDLIISNPPYVTESDRRQMSPTVLDYEPHLALFPPADNPLVFYRAIASFAHGRLSAEGRLFFEINESLADETAAIMHEQGFANVSPARDMQGKWRFLEGSEL